MALVSDALTTVSRVSSQLAGYDSDLDSMIENLINEATAFIKSFTNRENFKRGDFVEYYDGWNEIRTQRRRIQLNVYPVISVTSIAYELANTSSIGETPGSGTFNNLLSSDYYVDYDAGLLISASENGFPGGIGNLKVTYTAGYLIDFANPTTPANHTLPHDLTMACEKLVLRELHKRDHEGMSQISSGQSSTSFIEDIPADIVTILSKYNDPTL